MRFELMKGKKPIDAQYELSDDGFEAIIHSRGGAIGSPDARNPQYNEGLQTLLERLHSASIPLAGAWVDSKVVQA